MHYSGLEPIQNRHEFLRVLITNFVVLKGGLEKHHHLGEVHLADWSLFLGVEVPLVDLGVTGLDVLADPLVSPTNLTTQIVDILLDVNLGVLVLVELRKNLIFHHLLKHLGHDAGQAFEPSDTLEESDFRLPGSLEGAENERRSVSLNALDSFLEQRKFEQFTLLHRASESTKYLVEVVLGHLLRH